MIYKGVKFACGTCIKGHRSSNCNHVERPLFEIRKKGRPVTQCSFCRDLRKTKQVHIKCACTHKSTKEQQPILIYQTDDNTLVTPDCRDKCTCSDLKHDHHQQAIVTQPDEISGLLAHTNSMMTTSEGLLSNGIQPPSLVDTSFSWAVVTPTPEASLFANDDSVNLGFIFHKSSSQRFLEGQPRPPRKKSVKKQQPLSTSSTLSHQQRIPSSHSIMITSTPSSTGTSNGNMDCAQQHFMLPMMDLDLPSPSGSDNGVLTADLAMILNNVLKPMEHQAFKSEEEAMNQELANLELTRNTSNNGMMMYPTSSSTTTTSSSTPGTPPHQQYHRQQQQQQLLQHHHLTSSSSSPPPPPSSSSSSYLHTETNDITSSTSSSSSSSSSNGSLVSTLQQPFDQVGCCATQSMCRSDQSGPGESVVITIAPLSATTHHPLQGAENVRTRIVTCYCSGNCTCPGCLVHPGHFLAGDPFMDPYRGLSASTCPSSTASSIYSASDDEDHHHQQQQQQKQQVHPSILL